MKKLVSIVLTLCIVTSLMISPMSAFSATSGTLGDLTWRIEGTELIISGEGSMVAEDRIFVDDFESGVGFDIATYPWTNSRDLIEKVTIESGVTMIGDQAFVGFDKLKEVSIPDTVISIGNQAFLECDSIEEITIPGSVQYIDEGAFACCTGLKKVDVLDAGSYKDDMLKAGLYEEYYFYTRYIDSNAFMCCTGLESIDLSNDVTDINGYAFKGCTSLKDVTVSYSVTYIAENAFEDCSSEFTLHCPEKSYAYWYSVLVGLIEPPAFNGTKGDLTWEVKDDELVISGDGEMPNFNFEPIPGGGSFLVEYSDTWFVLKKYFSKVMIKPGVTLIGNGAFRGLDNIKEATISDGVKSIGEDAFFGCEGLEKINFSSGLVEIGSYAFCTCTSLNEVIIPEGVTSIGDGAFSWCDSLKEVTIPNSVTLMGDDAFENCSSELTIHCSRDSYAYNYAIENNIKVSVIGDEESDVHGDADGDGVFTVDDVSYVIHYILFSTVRPEHYPVHQDMDYNKDGKVDLNDAFVLLDEILYS